jgi:hypothetical protein
MHVGEFVYSCLLLLGVIIIIIFFQVQVVVELALEIYIFLGSHGELESEISGHNFTIT